MIEIKNFDKYPFVMEEKTYSFQNRKIYRYSKNKELFYLVTPSNDPAMKVKTVDEIRTLIRNRKMIQYTKSDNIFQKINKAWENWSDSWTHDGEQFFADAGTDLRDAPWHHEFGITYKIGYYHGNLVWVSGFQYTPKVCFTKFESIDKRPDWSKSGYTSMSNIKPVYSASKNSYI